MKRILVIDDDVEYCNEIQDILMDEDYHVLCAHEGQTGLQVLDSQPIDLVLLDLKLPELSGFDLLPAIKKIQPDVKVIIITGYLKYPDNDNQSVTTNAIRHSRLALADACFYKPFDVARLLSTIEQLIISSKH